MDLLRSAYSNSDDEGDDGDGQSEPLPHLKRFRIGSPFPSPSPPAYRLPQPQPRYHFGDSPVPQRYVSKRERALMASATPSAPDPIPECGPSSASVSITGSLLESNLHSNMLSLRHKEKGHPRPGLMPEKLSISLDGHKRAVSSLHWSTSHAQLLASAGMDHTVHVWNVWNNKQRKARVFNYHKAAVKDVNWSKTGWHMLTCGYDLTTRLIDVEKGSEIRVIEENQVVNVVKFHPRNPNLFLSGGEKGHLRLWDIRTGQVVHKYTKQLGPILDVEFSDDGKEFVSSSDVSRSNISENSIVVWDLVREVPLSNQVYGEAYTCTCIKRHPYEPYFVVQSHGNYIAIFSWSPPYRLDKFKRYEGHGVSGFPIKCSFSSDGDTLATGSAEGSIYLYNYRSTSLVRKIEAYSSACVDVAFHPTICNVVASCSWNGDVSVFE